MAKLPTVEDFGQRPTPEASRGVVGYQATTGNEGAEGMAVAQLGKELGVFAAKEQEKVDTTRVEDAWNKYKDTALQVTVGDNGVLRKQGGDAVNGDLLAKANAQLQTARKGIADGLSPDQLRRFNERANTTDMQVQHQTLDHLVQQERVYADVVQNGRFATAATQVAALPTDDRVFNSAVDELNAKSIAYLNTKGITDPGAQQAYLNEQRDKLITRRVDTLLYNMPELAEAKFRGLADSITNPELRLQYQARTREVSLGVISTNDANSIVADVRQTTPSSYAMLAPGTRDAELTKVNNALKVTPNDPDLLAMKTLFEDGEKRNERGIEVYAPSTNGLPSSRDIAAQLPLALMRIEKMADQRYGTDRGNPDRSAYIAKTTSAVQAKISSDVQQLNAIQKQAQGALIDAITGVSTGAPPAAAGGLIPTGGNPVGAGGMLITSFQQIQSNPNLARLWSTLDPQAKLGLERLMEHNMKAGASDQGDVRVYREVFNRIHLPEGNPDKIDFYQQIITPSIANSLSISQINSLRQEIDRQETPGGRSLTQMRKAADSQVATYFKTNIMFTAQPDRQIAATMAWNEAVGKKIDEAAKQPNGGDVVRDMFTLGSKNSVISQEYLQKFVNTTPAQGLAAGAEQVRTNAAPPSVTQPPSIDTREKLDAWFKTLPPGTATFKGTDGEIRFVPKTMVKGTSDVYQETGAAPRAVETNDVTIPGAVRMDATGKITDTPSIVVAPPPPPPSTAESMPTRVKPSTVADRYKKSGDKLEARRWENDARAYGRQQDLVSAAGRSAADLIPGYAVARDIVHGTDAAGRTIGQSLPVEQERVVSAFRDIVKRGYSELDADVISRAQALGEPFLTPLEIKKADYMLKELGATSGGGGGGGSMTQAEAQAAAKSGIFDDADRAARAARGDGKPTSVTAEVKGGTDDARTTGKSTKAQDETFISMWMRNTGESRTRALAELARIKRKGTM